MLILKRRGETWCWWYPPSCYGVEEAEIRNKHKISHIPRPHQHVRMNYKTSPSDVNASAPHDLRDYCWLPLIWQVAHLVSRLYFWRNYIYSGTFLSYSAGLGYPMPPENGKGTKRNAKGTCLYQRYRWSTFVFPTQVWHTIYLFTLKKTTHQWAQISQDVTLQIIGRGVYRAEAERLSIPTCSDPERCSGQIL